MKRRPWLSGFALLAALLAGTAGVAHGEDEKRPWLVSLSLNYGSWRTGDLDSDGTQALSFAQVSYEGKSWGAAINGVFVSTSYKASHAEDRFDVTTLADTDISTYYSIKRGGLTLRGGVDVGAPTGKSSYSEDELKKVMVDDLSQDLMLINTYGAGLNVAPHLMAVYRFKWGAAGLGARYEFTGEYDPATETAGDEFDPGDRLLLVLNTVARTVGEDYALFSLAYSRYGEDKQSGRGVFRQGDVIIATARYIRKWGGSFTSVAGVTYSTQRKNEVIGDGDTLESERANSNNNSLEAYVSGSYKFSGRLSATGLLGYKEVGANGYHEEDDYYDAGRSKAYIEPGMTWSFSSSVYATLRARYSRVLDKKDAASSEDAAYDVFNVDAGLVYSF